MKSSTETDIRIADAGLSANLERARQEHEFDRLLDSNGLALSRLAGSNTNSWFRGECAARTFLFRIAHNRAIDYLARNRARYGAAGLRGGGHRRVARSGA